MRLMRLTQYTKRDGSLGRPGGEQAGKPIAISPAHVMVIEPEPNGGDETQVTVSNGDQITVQEPFEKVTAEWHAALRGEPWVVDEDHKENEEDEEEEGEEQ